MGDEEAGFKKGHCCGPLFNIGLIRKQTVLDTPDPLYAVFIDLRAAFYSVYPA